MFLLLHDIKSKTAVLSREKSAHINFRLDYTSTFLYGNGLSKTNKRYVNVVFTAFVLLSIAQLF